MVKTSHFEPSNKELRITANGAANSLSLDCAIQNLRSDTRARVRELIDAMPKNGRIRGMFGGK